MQTSSKTNVDLAQLSKEVISHCKSTYDNGAGCGKCFLRELCKRNYILSIDNHNEHVKKINNYESKT